MTAEEIAAELRAVWWILIPIAIAAVVAIVYICALVKGDPGKRR